MSSLVSLDQSIFYLINGLHNGFLDQFMFAVTNAGEAYLLIPLAVLLFILTFKKHTWPLFLLIAVTLSVTDLVSHHLKDVVKRIRPSHALPGVHNVMNYTGGLYGFPSNHATNSFALAVLLSAFWPRKRGWFIGFAVLICYSRIYLGVHYPSDILGGAVIGSAIAGLLLISYRRLSKLYPVLTYKPT